MFNGVPDQFHQFGPSIPFPLSFPLHHHHHHGLIMSPSSTPPLHNFPSSCFDLYSPSPPVSNNSTTPQHMLHLHQQSCILAKKEKEDEGLVADAVHVAAAGTGCSNNIILAINNNNNNNDDDDVVNVVGIEDGVVNDDGRSMYHHHESSSTFDDLWSNDEVVALFKIRSGLQDNWFPDFTWDLVSRKLAELGYQRSGEKCKEKFEEESRRAQFNNVDMNYNKNYRFLTELNELYDHHHHHVELPADTASQILPDHEKNPLLSQDQQYIEEDEKKNSTDDDDSPANKPCEENLVEKSVTKKRKRKNSDDDEKFEMLMGFCGNVVKKVIEKQEEMHRKVVEDMLKKEEESIAREEAWRNQEIRKIEKEIELRGQEKANASENEAKMIELLTNFIVPPTLFDSHSLEDQIFFKKMQALFMSSSSSQPTQITGGVHGILVPYSTSSLQNPDEAKEDSLGKRWPRDEVLALINIRCKFNNNNNNNEDKDSSSKGPLWERISKGMMGMGYKRSAKRCKEKWENINKYFRKTKDIKKKRTEDSRTCPYFQQLSCLYSHQQQQQENHNVDAPEN